MRFEPPLRQLFETNGPDVREPRLVAAHLGGLLEREGPDSAAARRYLERTGLRRKWNYTLRDQRSLAMAEWLHPHVEGVIVDVFAGDLSVACALNRTAANRVIAVERTSLQASSPAGDGVILHAFRDFNDLSGVKGDTAILVTALHHERDPDAVLVALAAGSTRRWLVVENCIDAEFDASFHLAADTFFNKCLNRTELYCGHQHRTVLEWRERLRVFGQIVTEETRTAMPGVFLPHTLFVLARDVR